MDGLLRTTFPVQTHLNEKKIVELLGSCIVNPSYPYVALVPPSGHHAIHAEAELKAESTTQFEVQDKVECIVTRRIEDYRAIFDTTWRSRKNEIHHMLDANDSVFMIVSIRSSVKLPVDAHPGVQSSGQISIASSAAPYRLAVTDNGSVLSIDPSWFETDIAPGEVVKSVEVRQLTKKKNIMSLASWLFSKLGAMFSLKPDVSTHLVQRQ